MSQNMIQLEPEKYRMLVAMRYLNAADSLYSGLKTQQGKNDFHFVVTTRSNRIDGYSYDLAGNLLNDGINTYTYDAENRVVTYSNTVGGSASYVYDAFGSRVEKTSNTQNECNTTGGTVFYIRDLSGHTAVYTQNGVNQCHDEIYLGGRHFVTYEGRATFSHADWLGTERLGIAAPFVNSPQYDQPFTSYPFGDDFTGNTSGYATTLRFTGQPHDLESNLEYFGARYYSSNEGRFLSTDPLKNNSVFALPMELNRYTYGENNPLRYVDPNGLCSIPAGIREGQIGICISAFIAAKRLGFWHLSFGDDRGPMAYDRARRYRWKEQIIVDPSTGQISAQAYAGLSCAVFEPFCLPGSESTQISQERDANGNTLLRIQASAVNGFERATHGFLGPSGVIQADLLLIVSPNGSVSLGAGSQATSYPSFEIYTYNSTGKSKQVAFFPEGDIDGLTNPMVTLLNFTFLSKSAPQSNPDPPKPAGKCNPVCP
jgi:RHS repeat-associated protein